MYMSRFVAHNISCAGGVHGAAAGSTCIQPEEALHKCDVVDTLWAILLLCVYAYDTSALLLGQMTTASVRTMI
jgi:hypothetical protein